MKNLVIFYAWQSDRPNNINRGFIEKALDDAVKQFNATSQEIQIQIDQGTQGVAGMPPVSETILEKIRNCDIFLPDLTFVAKIEGGDKVGHPIPNANVLIEFGYALCAKGHSFLMPVMNTAFEGPGGLPFDMGHLRHPILYRASELDGEEARRKERTRLSTELLNAIKATVGNIAAARPARAITKEMKAWAADNLSMRTNTLYQLIPTPLIAGPKLLMHICPLDAYEKTAEIDFSLISKLSQHFVPFHFERSVSDPDVDSWRFFAPPHADRKGMFPGRIEPAVGQSMWFTEISRYGATEVISMIDTVGMPSDTGPITIEGSLLEALIVGTIENLVIALTSLGIQPPAILQCALVETRDCKIFLSRAHGRFTRQPIILPEVILDKFEAPIAKMLRPLLDAIWRAAGWAAGSPSFSGATWAGYGTQ